MSLWVLYLLFLKASVTSFSGFGSVPVLRDELVVDRGALTDAQLNDAIAISQASPGPIGVYLVVVGFSTAGVAGAIIGMLALATPALLAVPVLYAVKRGRAAAIRGGTTGVIIVSCVLIISAGLSLAPQAVPTPAFLALAGAGILALATTRIPPVLVVALSAVVGLFLS